MKRFTTALLCATIALTACDAKETPPPVQKGDNDPLPTLPEPEPRVEPEFDALATEVGLGTTTQPGPLDGAWELQRASGQTVATIHFRHEAGEPDLKGVVKMSDGALAKLHPAAQFSDERLLASWVLDYDGRNYRFAMTDGMLRPDGRVQVRFAEQRDGSIADAYLVRPR